MGEDDPANADAGKGAEADDGAGGPQPGEIPWKEVLETVRRALSGGGRSAHFHSAVTMRDINFGDHGRTVTSVSLVSEEALLKVGAVYEPPSCDADARSRLGKHHLVILSATNGAGRYCAALHLLGDVDGDRPIQVVEVATGDLKEICARDYERGVREVVLVQAAGPAGLGWHAIEALCHKLRDLEAHVVVSLDATIDLPPQARHAVVVHWRVDVANDVLLRRHLDWYRAPTPAELAEGEQVRRVLSAGMQPRELDRLARLLAEAAAGGASVEDALRRFEGEVDGEVAEWFKRSSRLDEYALIVALATLEGAATAEVLDAAHRLEDLLTPAGQSRDVMSATSAAPLNSRLETVRARREHRTVQTEFGPVQQEILLAANTAWPPAVLRHVWRQHDAARPALLRWWRDLAENSSIEVRIGVVSALTEVCDPGFAELLQAVLKPWAQDHDPGVRWIAAAVLGLTACRESDAGAQARRLLWHWSTLRNQDELRLTAALAYAYLGGIQPILALQGLNTIVASAESHLLKVAAGSLVTVFDAQALAESGAGTDLQWRAEVGTAVLRVLRLWSSERRHPFGPVALRAFVTLAGGPEDGGGEDNAWPALLRLVHASPDADDAARALWARSLDDQRTRERALETLRSWIDWDSPDAELSETLEKLVVGLARAGGPRGRQRLRFSLARWARDRQRPSTLAGRLLEALEALEQGD
jgi:hypothetical protein